MRVGAGVHRLASRLPSSWRGPLRRLVRPEVSIDEDAVDPWDATGADAVFFERPHGDDGPTPPLDGRQTTTGLRCLLVTDALDTGGLDEVVAFLARSLPMRGATVAVVHAQPRARPLGRLGEQLRSEGVEVVPLTEADLDWIHAWRPDVVSAHGAPLWSLEAAARSGVPVVETLHGMHDFFSADPMEVGRRTASLSAVAAVSELVRRQYLATDPGSAPARVVTIPNGVDAGRVRWLPRDEARRRLGLSDEFLWVSLARHSLQKNTYGLVAAFDEVAAAQPDARLLVAGRPEPGDYPTQVRRLQRRMRHGAQVRLADAVSAPSALLAAADGFVLDSFFEGWALSTMEAMATGLPVVMADVGGAREQLEGHPERGLLVDNPLGDPLAVSWSAMSDARYRTQVNREQLVQALLTTARPGRRSPEERRELGAAALTDFSAARCLDGHVELLEAVQTGLPR